MPAAFYARIANKVYGPFDSEKLKNLAVAGKLTRDDFLSKDGKTGWTLAGNVKGLFPPAELLLPGPPQAIQTVVRQGPPAIPSEEQTKPAEYSDDLIVYTAQATRDTAVSAVKATGQLTVKGASLVARGAVATAKIIGAAANQVQAPLPAVPTASSVAPLPAATAITACPFCAEQILAVAKKCKHCGEILDAALRQAMAPASQFVQAGQPVIHINNVNTNVVNGGASKRWSPLLAFFLSLMIPGLGQLYKGQVLNGVVWFIVVAIGYVAFIVPGIVLQFFCALGAAAGDPYR